MATFQLPDRVACYRHADHLAGVHCTRCGRPICLDCMVVAPVGHHCPTCVTEGAQGSGAGSRLGRRPGRSSRLTPVVAALIVINGAVFVLTTTHRTWEFDYAQIPSLVAHRQAYRLLTATFVHENIPHLVFNMAALFISGPPIERALGRRRFVLLYLLAALGGSVCSFVFGPVLVAGVGASGAIFGIFGAWFSLARAQRSETGVIMLLIAILLAYSFYDTAIDWRAHVGGLVTGVVVGATYAWAARRPARQRLAYQGAVVVGLLAVLAALVLVRAAQL
ncbi:MAG: rhomboid family intramembrane serine protease [Actinomycetota bacterium]|nr:rhomboid family intramembrane serine protease [Actinomycetota bacterium]